MTELSDNDLRKLFQMAGHASPDRDLTDLIMARVAVTRIAEPVYVAPLISKRTWAVIALCIMLLIAGVFSISSSGLASPSHPWGDGLVDALGRMKLPEGAWPQWTIGLSALSLLFAVLVRKAELRAIA